MGFLHMLINFCQVGLQICQLRLQALAMRRQHLDKAAQLHTGIARRLVEVDDFLGFLQGQSQALGPQGQAQACALLGRVHALLAAGAGGMYLLMRDRSEVVAAPQEVPLRPGVEGVAERDRGPRKRFVALKVDAGSADAPYMSTIWHEGAVAGEVVAPGGGGARSIRWASR